MATVDPSSPSYAKTEQGMKMVFRTYKLKFALEDFKILSVKGNTAQIQATTLTKKVSGPAFRNNRVKMTTILVKKAGKWLMSGSKVDKIDYLN
jgi:hypothetical protein